MTYLERAFVRRGHPRYLILGMVGFIWGMYFLWFHNWIWAVASILLSAVLGRILTAGMREENLAQTTLGKIMLLHLHPVNLLVQLLGSGFLLYSVWIHSGRYISVAVSVILIGHMWGWNKVNDAL